MKSIVFNRLCRALVLLAALLEFSADANAQTATPRRTSIIFIQVDGLGYGDLSCYGQTNFQTPNLDKLAAEGMRFTNYFAAADSFSSQAELMMGKNSMQGIPFYPGHLIITPNSVVSARLLRNSGYHTGLIGEWYLGNETGAPWKEGFDEFAGYSDPNDAENFYINYIFRYAPKSLLDTNNVLSDFIGKEELYPNDDNKKQEYIPDLFAKAALNFVQINAPDAANHYRPFFLLLNFKIPAGKIEVPTDAPFSEEPWPQQEKNRAALIARIDGYIGQLQDQLQQIRMTNNVAIFFSSASVPEKSGEIDPEFFHSNISTNDFRVPMIVHWPEHIPAGQVSGHKWSAQDFLPTAAEIAFLNSPTNIDGVSVLPVLLGRKR